MDIYCISLDSASERRQHCGCEFDREGIEVQMVQAVDARANGLTRLCRDFPDGALGCSLSHLALAEQLSRGRESPSIIFEDDICLQRNFRRHLEEAMQILPPDWQLAFIGWEQGGWPAAPRFQTKVVNDYWMEITAGCLWGFHAYAVNGKEGAATLYRLMQPFTTTIDSQVFQAILDKQAKAYFLCEKLAWQCGGFKSQTL